jgi:hypothetical protein
VVQTGWDLVGVADLNGDGKHELVWRNQITGQTGFWKLNTNGQVTSSVLPVEAAPWEIAGAPYFDGRNGIPEILCYNAQTGLVGFLASEWK